MITAPIVSAAACTMIGVVMRAGREVSTWDEVGDGGAEGRFLDAECRASGESPLVRWQDLSGFGGFRHGPGSAYGAR